MTGAACMQTDTAGRTGCGIGGGKVGGRGAAEAPRGLLVAEGLRGAALLVGPLEDGEDVMGGVHLSLFYALRIARSEECYCNARR